MASLLTAALGVTAVGAAPAMAQPAPPPAGGCTVELVRAAPEVARVVEQWIAAEPSCTRLVVRIVPTEGGLYVVATAPDGRAWDRVVPDAQTAGVLVASWAADGRPAPAPRPGAEPEPATSATAPPVAPTLAATTPAPVASPTAAPPPPVAAPGAAPWTAAAAPVDHGVSTAATTGPAPVRRFEVGTLFDGDSFGLRLGADLRPWARLRGGRLGLTLGADATDLMVIDGSAQTTASFYDYRVMAHAAVERPLGARVRLRAAAAAGLGVSKLDVYVSGMYVSGLALTPTGEAGVAAVVGLGDHWRLQAGPRLTVTPPLQFDSDDPAVPSVGIQARAELRAGLGLDRDF